MFVMGNSHIPHVLINFYHKIIVHSSFTLIYAHLTLYGHRLILYVYMLLAATSSFNGTSDCMTIVISIHSQTEEANSPLICSH